MSKSQMKTLAIVAASYWAIHNVDALSPVKNFLQGK